MTETNRRLRCVLLGGGAALVLTSGVAAQETAPRPVRPVPTDPILLPEPLKLPKDIVIPDRFPPLIAAQRLPVYRLARPSMTDAQAERFFAMAFGEGQVEPTESSDKVMGFTAEGRMLEYDLRGGGLFIADTTRLWKNRKADLPSPKEAVAVATGFFDEMGLAETAGDPVRFSLRAVAETGFLADAPNARPNITERIVTFGATIETEAGPVEVVGGGSEYSITLSDGGEVIGVQGAFRPLTGIAGQVSIAPAADALASFQKDSFADFAELDARLVYYARPGFREQDELRPAYEIRGTVFSGDNGTPMRITYLDAETLRPIFTPEPEAMRPEDKSKDRENRREEKGQDDRERFGFLDLFFPNANAALPHECGTDWIGTSQGLNGSSGNRAGFTRGCRNMNWQVSFDWGNFVAWKSDFTTDDDRYVDAVDLVFYTGHAGLSEWNVYRPGQVRDKVRSSDVQPGTDMWGDTDLEWLIVAACGPHQDSNFVTGGGNAFDRWRGVFDGMHNFLAYGAVTFDNEDEGARFTELVRDGWSVHDAWFRTAKDVQRATNGEEAPNGPNIYVTDMIAHDGSQCPFREKVHGKGLSCPDVRAGSGQVRTLAWSGT